MGLPFSSLRLLRGFPLQVFVVVNELGSITDNDEYMLHLWVWNEGTMGLPVVRFPRFPDNESVEQTTAWGFPPPVLPRESHTFVAENTRNHSDFPISSEKARTPIV